MSTKCWNHHADIGLYQLFAFLDVILGQLESVKVISSSVKLCHSSSFPHTMYSVLFNENRAKRFVGDKHNRPIRDIRCTWKADNHRLRWKTWREVKFGLTLDRNFFKTKAHFSFFKTTFIDVSASCEEDSLFWSLILYVQKLRTRPGEYVKPQ